MNLPVGNLATLAVALSLVAIGCGGPSSGQGETTAAPPECASRGMRGTPVSLDELVRIMRANGVTLDINQRKCQGLEPTDPDATNFGPEAIEPDDEVKRREGLVFCDVGSKGGDRREVIVTKYPNDAETRLDALNVGCTIYPSDAASEDEQIDRLKRALEAVIRETPPQ